MKKILVLAFGILGLFAFGAPLQAQEQLIVNGGFEDGITGWTNTRPDKCYHFGTVSPGHPGALSAKWTCTYGNETKLLVSNEFNVTRGQWYTIRLFAYSKGFPQYYDVGSRDGENLWLYVSPCADTGFTTSAGIRNYPINVLGNWRLFVVRFKATKTTCARMGARASGNRSYYYIDNFGLTWDAVDAASVDGSESVALLEGPQVEPVPALYLPVITR